MYSLSLPPVYCMQPQSVKKPSITLLPIDATGTPPTDLPGPGDLIQAVCASTAALYETVGFLPPWIGYLSVYNGTIVGTCAFKSPPKDDKVEIAYFTFPGFEGKGIATEMARMLVQLAHETAPQITLLAQTLPEHNASGSVLRKLGFAFAGYATDSQVGEVWEWQLECGRRNCS